MNNTLRDTNSRIDRFSASLLSRLRRDRSIARMVLILLVAIGVFSVLSPSVFLTGLNLQNMLLAVAEIGILSIAMMISMVTGGIDLSLVAIANLCAITVSTLYTSSALGGSEQWGPVIILIGLGVGLLCGLVNGVLIAYVGVTPILATLGTMQIFNGLAVVWTGGKTLYGSPEALTAFGKTAVAGVPLLFIVFGLVALLVGFILNRSPLGLSLSLEGSNGTAARFSGIRSSRILLSSYLLTGFLGSLTGIVFIARNPTASADYGASYVLLVIVIAVLGGTNPNGGFATVGGVFLAALTLQVVQSGFTSMRLSAFQYAIAQGVILIGVLVLDCVDWKDVRTRLTSTFRRPQPAAALNSGAFSWHTPIRSAPPETTGASSSAPTAPHPAGSASSPAAAPVTSPSSRATSARGCAPASPSATCSPPRPCSSAPTPPRPSTEERACSSSTATTAVTSSTSTWPSTSSNLTESRRAPFSAATTLPPNLRNAQRTAAASRVSSSPTRPRALPPSAATASTR